MNHEGLRTVPETLASHTHLRRLYVWGNALTSAPDWLWDFRQRPARGCPRVLPVRAVDLEWFQRVRGK